MIFEQLALALKNKVCPGIFYCNEIFFTFTIFEQVALALKNSLPEIFHCIEIFFIIQEF